MRSFQHAQALDPVHDSPSWRYCATTHTPTPHRLWRQLVWNSGPCLTRPATTFFERFAPPAWCARSSHWVQWLATNCGSGTTTTTSYAELAAP